MKRRRAPRITTPPAAPPPRAPSQADPIYALVRRIPRGSVITYGELAALAGIPSGHRIAARAMRTCPDDLPWQRVLGKKDARRAQINIDDPDHASLQRGLLEREGVVFDAKGFVSLARFGWLSQAVGHDAGKARRAVKKRAVRAVRTVRKTRGAPVRKRAASSRARAGKRRG